MLNKFILSKIEAIEDNKQISSEKYSNIPLIISIIPTTKVISEQELDNKLGKLYSIYDNTVNIEAKLSCISYDIFKSKLYSHDIISKLDAMKQELEKLNEIVKLNEFSLDELNSTHANELNGLKNDLMKRLTEIETLVNSFPKNNDTQRIIDLLNKLKQSNLDRLLQKSFKDFFNN